VDTLPHLRAVGGVCGDRAHRGLRAVAARKPQAREPGALLDDWSKEPAASTASFRPARVVWFRCSLLTPRSTIGRSDALPALRAALP
jgi:hypothetical protein